MNLTFVIKGYKSANTYIKIVVVYKLPNFDTSVFDDFLYYNISRSNATSRDGYIRVRRINTLYFHLQIECLK